MRPFTLFRLAVAGGRADILRIALTAVGAALATLVLLATATVLSIRGGSAESGQDAPYRPDVLAQAGLRPGVAFALVCLCIPIVFFVGQCARVGAPARDRRLAAVRMAGATPRQAGSLAVAETGVAALLGAAAGGGAYVLLRALLDDPDAAGLRPLPTDVLPPVGVLAAILLGVPVLGALAARLALRRVLLTPFGVVRRERTRPPQTAPAILFGVGAVGLAFVGALTAALNRWIDGLPAELLLLLTALLALLTAAGLVSGTAALSSLLGRAVARRARRPAVLIAARRLVADPWAASRSLAALLVAVFLGAAVLGVRASFLLDGELQAEASRRLAVRTGDRMGDYAPDPFYARTFDQLGVVVWIAVAIAAAGLLVAVVEQTLERRRTLAALVAHGTPRSVLGRAALLQVFLPLVPGIVLGCAAGVLAARGLFGTRLVAEMGAGGCTASPPGADPATWCDDPAHQLPEITVRVARDVAVPWADLSVLGGGAIVGTLLLTAVGLVLLRRSTDVAEMRAAA